MILQYGTEYRIISSSLWDCNRYTSLVPSPLSLVERKQRQARQRIVHAADVLFAERGFDDVSVGDIATMAEVGRTTFFRLFGDKQEVVFSKEQELLETIDAADQSHVTGPRTAAEAVEQLRSVVLALCHQATADPEAYVRHVELVEGHHELRARDAIKLQMMADRLSDLLVRRGTDEQVAVLAGQIALACYQTARRLGGGPRRLADETRAAFDRVLALGHHHHRRS